MVLLCLAALGCEDNRARHADGGEDFQGSGGAGGLSDGAGGAGDASDAGAGEDRAEAGVDAVLDGEVDGSNGPEVTPPPPDCSDGNVCTLDSFDGTACVHVPVPDGTACDDGDLCTVGDRCTAGACMAGSAASTTMRELGRLETFGADRGAVMAVEGTRFAYLDGAALHVARFEGTSPLVESGRRFWDGSLSLVWSGYDETTALPLPRTAWAGHAAMVWDSVLNTIVIDAQGQTAAETRTTFPKAGGFLVGHGKGVAGSGAMAWVCVNYSFLGPPSGAIHGYDLTNPATPTWVASAGIPAACGSTAISADGHRIYTNTPNGIYWFDPAIRDQSSQIVVNGPFGSNSDLAVYGPMLVARETATVRLYNETDRTEKLAIPAEGVSGASYLVDEDMVALVRQVMTDGVHYERTLELYDARTSAAGSRLDSVRLSWERSARPGEELPTSGGIIVDPRSKVPFRVVGGKLQRLSAPMMGGARTLAPSDTGLRVLAPGATLDATVSDLASMSWQATGGPALGLTHVLALDVSGPTPVLVQDPIGDYTELPLPDRVIVNGTLFRSGTNLEVTLRDGRDEEGLPATRGLLLAGGESGVLQWAGDALFRVSSQAPDGLRLRRWDRALLIPSATPVSPREDVLLRFTQPLPASASDIQVSMDVPSSGTVGLALLSYSYNNTPSTYRSAARLLWFDRTATPMAVIDEVTLEATPGTVSECRVAGPRAVCLAYGGERLVLVERSTTPGTASVRVVDLQTVMLDGILAFDGRQFICSGEENTTIVTALPFDLTDQDLVSPPMLRFSANPSAVAQVPGGYVAASKLELVAFSPQCASP